MQLCPYHEVGHSSTKEIYCVYTKCASCVDAVSWGNISPEGPSVDHLVQPLLAAVLTPEFDQVAQSLGQSSSEHDQVLKVSLLCSSAWCHW